MEGVATRRDILPRREVGVRRGMHHPRVLRHLRVQGLEVRVKGLGLRVAG